MKIGSVQLWLGLLSAGAVFYVALGDLGRKSPGELSRVHGREDGLEASCAQCHGGWFGDMPASCLDCHEVIAEQIDAGAGLHGRLGADRVTGCGMCHSEHHGDAFAIVNRQSFALAGVPDPEEFDHEVVGFAMGGAHALLECAACHEHANAAVLPAGAMRYGGLDQNCASCHDDPHGGRMVVGCAQCHSQDGFYQPASAGHERFLGLVGAHAETECTKCHVEGTAHSLESIGTGRPHRVRACGDCHESPHQSGFTAGIARATHLGEAAACAECHHEDHVGFGQGLEVFDLNHHAFSGFSLEAPHQDLQCEACHPQSGDPFAVRYPGRDAQACESCHQDPHGGQFAAGPRRECLDCHSRQHFEPHAFDHDMHAALAMPLTGAHTDAECASCHQDPAEGTPRQFRGTVERCEQCHADAHSGFFASFESHLATAEEGSCSYCHSTESFADVDPHSFAHGDWTGFALNGAHAEAHCESCHPRAEHPDPHGRRFGSVAKHFGEFSGCATCHRDPHQGHFDTVDLPSHVAGRVGCARCHTETSFRSFPGGFDHLQWTGFALQGAHGRAECSTCHEPLRSPDEHGRTWGRAAGQQCSDCHVDSHAGQFEVQGQTDCRRCHASAESFHDLVFHHEIQSRFPLGDAHSELACTECHQPETMPDGGEIVRYKPMGRECIDCHGEQGGPLRRRGGGR